MKYTLRPYQQEAVDKAVEFFLDDTKKHNALMVLSTGAGKSILVSAIAQRLNTNILVLQPSKELTEQNYEKGVALGLDCSMYSASVGQKIISPLTFATIGSIKNCTELFEHFQYIIVDEAHVCNSKKGLYKDFFKALPRKVLGMTATPFRLESHPNMDWKTKKLKGRGTSELKMMTKYRGAIFKEIIYNIETGFLVNQGFLSYINYYDLTPVEYDTASIKKNSSGSDYDEKSLNAFQIKHNTTKRLIDLVYRVLNPKRPEDARKGVLVFVRSIEEAKNLASLDSQFGYVSGDMNKKDRERILASFKSGRTKVIFNGLVLEKGFDYPALDCVILATPTMSLARYTQECLDMQTEVLTKRGFMSYENIREDDMVCAYDNGNMIWTPIEEIIHRKLGNERMVSYCSQHSDFRVTEGHDMIFKACGAVSYHKDTAEKMCSRKNMIKVPVSGLQEAEGLPLTDDEIRFLGWAYSDGGLNKHNNVVTISQSFVNPDNIIEIERVLQSCKLRYGKHLIKRKGDLAKYKDYYRFTISKGDPLKREDRDNGLTGWFRFAPYYNGCKKWNENLEKLDERQFDIFLKTLELADGSHQKGMDWTPRTYTITMGNDQEYCDRFQSLAIRRGYRCNMRSDLKESGRILYVLHFKKQTYSTVNGTNVKDGLDYKRKHLKVQYGDPNEYVWCVRDKYGSIVTRRNGRVLITGNCGRTIRIADDKNTPWVIDLCGNYKRFGRTDMLYLAQDGEIWSGQYQKQLTGVTL